MSFLCCDTGIFDNIRDCRVKRGNDTEGNPAMTQRAGAAMTQGQSGNDKEVSVIFGLDPKIYCTGLSIEFLSETSQGIAR